MRRSRYLVFLLALLLTGTSRADESVGVLFVREYGLGSAAQAQPYIDKFGQLLAARMGWSRTVVRYETTRAGASDFIRNASPRYAFLSLTAFLAMREALGLDVLGQMEIMGSGRRYHVVSRDAANLDACRGKTLATLYDAETRFFDRVVFAGAAHFADFTVTSTRRPTQTLRKVTNNEANCALIDDGMLAELPKIEGAAGVKAVWSSAPLPLMVIAAFPSASAEERRRFQVILPDIIRGDGRQICEEMGLKAVQAASNADLAPLIRAYEGK